jgi:hypothetical protein
VPSGASPVEVAESEGAPAKSLDKLANDMGCRLENGPGVFTSSCQVLLDELARARGNAQRALAILTAEPSLKKIAEPIRLVDAALAGSLVGCRYLPGQWRIACLGVASTLQSINVYTQLAADPGLSTVGKVAAFNIAVVCLSAGGQLNKAQQKRCLRLATAVGAAANIIDKASDR